MAEEIKAYHSKKKTVARNSGTGGLWIMGFIGSLVYYLHYHSGTFWLVVVAVFKSIFWLAYVVYYVLRFMRV